MKVSRQGGGTLTAWLRFTLIAAVILAAIAQTFDSRAATVTGASIENQDGVAELHFPIRGRGLGWHLSVHGQQLWIDLNNVRMDLATRPLIGQEVSPVSSVQVIYAGGVRGRIVVEVTGRTDYAIGQLPHVLVLRLAPAGKMPNLASPLLTRMDHRRRAAPPIPDPVRPVPAPGGFETAKNTPPSMPAPKQIEMDGVAAEHSPGNRVSAPPPAEVASLTAPIKSIAPRASRQVVVVDAGHGGRDPGTEAAGDVAEKDVALRIALRLRDALQADGIDVRLTRDDDTFLTLAERTHLANEDHADLFVSIHLNSSPDPDTAGIETYYLNNTTDRATIRLARMENEVAGGYGASDEPNLNYILTDLRQQDKANESASLARMIEAETVADIEASMGTRVNELGAKQGPFYVLVGALMPSVLVECGFLSNPGEARQLESPQYQQEMAGGIARAIVHYFNADAAVGNL